MNLTREEAKALGRRAQQPTKAPGEILAIWVPGKLVNTKNARLHYMAESRYKREWRERVALAMWESRHLILDCLGEPAEVPKRVVFAARTYHKLDSDGLQVALAPVRDALIEYGVIHGDADKHGHEFIYLPSVIDRARRGVEIRVSLRAHAPEARTRGASDE
jgi:hypothetical protein